MLAAHSGTRLERLTASSAILGQNFQGLTFVFALGYRFDLSVRGLSSPSLNRDQSKVGPSLSILLFGGIAIVGSVFSNLRSFPHSTR